jgi:nucleoid DNA-binding protein
METKAQKDKFFQAVANNCKFRDVDMAKDVYYAMVRTIIQECKSKGKILLPDFGEMVLMDRKARVIRNVNTGLVDTTDAYRSFKFNMSRMLKHYINKK